MLPKSSAELLAAAKRPQNQTRKPKIKHDLNYSQYLSTIPIIPMGEISTVSYDSAQFRGGTQLRFNEPVTPQSLGAAFEIDSDVDNDPVLLPTWVVTQYY